MSNVNQVRSLNKVLSLIGKVRMRPPDIREWYMALMRLF